MKYVEINAKSELSANELKTLNTLFNNLCSDLYSFILLLESTENKISKSDYKMLEKLLNNQASLYLRGSKNTVFYYKYEMQKWLKNGWKPKVISIPSFNYIVTNNDGYRIDSKFESTKERKQLFTDLISAIKYEKNNKIPLYYIPRNKYYGDDIYASNGIHKLPEQVSITVDNYIEKDSYGLVQLPTDKVINREKSLKTLINNKNITIGNYQKDKDSYSILWSFSQEEISVLKKAFNSKLEYEDLFGSLFTRKEAISLSNTLSFAIKQEFKKVIVNRVPRPNTEISLIGKLTIEEEKNNKRFCIQGRHDFSSKEDKIKLNKHIKNIFKNQELNSLLKKEIIDYEFGEKDWIYFYVYYNKPRR